MRAWAKISGYTVAVIVLAVLAALVSVQSPAVQEKIGRAVVNRLEKSMDADITTGAISIQPLEAICLRDVVIMDKEPVIPGTDTVARIGLLSAKFSIKAFLGGDCIYLSRARIKDCTVNLVTENDPSHPGKTYINLLRVLGLLPQNDIEPQPLAWGNILSARIIELENIDFRLVSESGSPVEIPDGAIDFTDLRVKINRIRARGIRLKDSHIYGSVDRLDAVEKRSGLHIKDLAAASVNVGEAQVRLKNIHLKTAESDLLLTRLRLIGAIEDYAQFLDKIRIEADIRQGSILSSKTIGCFAGDLQAMDLTLSLSGRMNGYVNDFRIENLAFRESASGVEAKVDGELIGLPDTESTLLDVNVKSIRFTTPGLARFINGLAPDAGLDLSGFGKGEHFTFAGRVKGLLNKFTANGTLRGAGGKVQANLSIRNVADVQKPIGLGGCIDIDQVNVGRIIGEKALGPASLRTVFDATLSPDNLRLKLDSLKISHLHAAGYDYSGISARGTYEGNAFDGRIYSGDPNLYFLFQGIFNFAPRNNNAIYKFYAVLNADLNAIKLDKRPRSHVSLSASSNFRQTDRGHLIGDVHINDLAFDSETGHHEVGDIIVRAHSASEINRVQLTSRFLEGGFVGDKTILDFINDLQDLTLRTNIPALIAGQRLAEWDSSSYDMWLKVHEAREILEFFAPGVYVEDGSALNLNVTKNGKLSGHLTSGRLAKAGTYAKDLDLVLDNQGGSLNAKLTSGSIMLSGVEMKGNNLTLSAKDNNVSLKYLFDNGQETLSGGNIALDANLSRRKNDLIVSAKALPSRLSYDGNDWDIRSEDIVIDGNDIKVGGLSVKHEAEEITLEGGISMDRADTLRLRLNRFDISLLDSVTGGTPSLKGKASGYASVISPMSPAPGLLASLRCEESALDGHDVGTLFLDSSWNDKTEAFDFTIKNRLKGINNLSANGSFRPEVGQLDATMGMKQFDLAYAGFVLNGIFSEFSGGLSGTVGVHGPLDNLQLSSENLRINNGLLALDFTRVPYRFDGDLSLDNRGLHFDDVFLTDGQSGSGKVSGSLVFNDLTKLDLGTDIHLNLENLQVLGIPPGINPLMYGTLYGGGNVDVVGPLDAIQVNVDVTSSGEGNFHLMVEGAGGDSGRSLLTFTQPVVEKEPDAYELMMGSREKTKESKSGSTRISVRANILPEVTAYVDISQEMSLYCGGTGTILVDLDLSSGMLGLGGAYNISGGNFRLSVMNLVKRDFAIQDGSTVRFNGDVMNTDLDVNAVYATKASLANLVSDDSASGMRQVNCTINLSEKLASPQIKFGIDIPDLNPTMQVAVDGALNTEDKVQKQFVYMLISGGFLPSEESGVASQQGSDVLISNVSGIMANQINNIFQKLDIPLDLGLNYKPTQTGQDMFDVALSTQLFNNRVIVNGSVGNKQQYGMTTNEIAGNLDVEVKLNKGGDVRMNFFSHSADELSSYLDNSQRNGAGVTYQKEFNKLGGLFKDMFRSKKKKKADADAEALRQTEYVTMQIDSTGRAK